jgi:hypothetical protein
MVECRMDLFGSRQVSVVGSCGGHGTELMGSIKYRNFLDHLSKCYVLRKDSQHGIS